MNISTVGLTTYKEALWNVSGLTSSYVDTKVSADFTYHPYQVNVTSGSDEIELVWKDSTFSEPTTEQINVGIVSVRKNNLVDTLRPERNHRLSKCDWITSKYADSGEAIPDNWKTYRQTLRDLPSNVLIWLNDKDIDTVDLGEYVWPVEPT